jgi:hypothetical protein
VNVELTFSAFVKKANMWRVGEEQGGKGMFAPKRVEVTGVWGTLHSEELRSFYSSQNVIRMIK